jgi:hypothetical protein
MTLPLNNLPCCRNSRQCGRKKKGHYRKCLKKRYKCPNPRYNGFFEMMEGTGANMEIDNMEFMSDLDYGITGYGISSPGI